MAEIRWKNGVYKSSANLQILMKVEGNDALVYPHVYLDHPDIQPTIALTWTYGDFGPARKEVQDAANGVENYNIKMAVGLYFIILGIVSEDGKTIYAWSMFDTLDVVQWLDDEALEQLKENREPSEASSCPYKIQPENQGKLIWLTGPPGAGKSTTGQLLGKETDFVYYESDCLSGFLNPFVPLDMEDPSKAAFKQPRLKGISKEGVEANLEYGKLFTEINSGQVPFKEVNFSRVKPFYKYLTGEVSLQRKRIGGNFAVANVVTSREYRDYVRQFVPDVIFVILNLNRDTQRKRVQQRHGEGEAGEAIIKLMLEFYDLFEPPCEDEVNTYSIDVEENMTPSDVKDKVLQVLNMK